VDHGVGGALDPPVEVVPEFNSLVAFRVWAGGPHVHEVTPVLTDRARRYSVFGWFLSRDMPI
jgi:Rps23 Pro-64 3,4-dihydroxylase Tpa1-like proline 4-hydroxylase